MITSTIISHPNRGHWGNPKYRGNCSGHVIKGLLETYQPKRITDYMVGSGTTKAVADELGVEYRVYDLNPAWGGFDALNDELPSSSDFIFWHPPYHDIIPYSGNMWGKEDPRDLGRCGSYGEFIQKVNKIQAKMLASLRKGGRLAILVGDVKRKGVLYSIQKDMDWYGQPEQVIIKAQHNCWSDQKDYGGRRNFIPIQHEYLMVFKRDDCYIVPARIVKMVEVDLSKSRKVTWRDLVLATLQQLGGRATLEELYQEMEHHVKTQTNPHWQAKIRQVVQLYDDFTQHQRGTWKLAPLGASSGAGAA